MYSSGRVKRWPAWKLIRDHCHLTGSLSEKGKTREYVVRDAGMVGMVVRRVKRERGPWGMGEQGWL